MDFHIERYTHTFKDGSTVSVRGLNMDDLGSLVRNHGELMEIVFEGDFSAIDVITRAPALVADMIALSADEPDQADTAAKLPLPVQVLLLTEISRLTFSEIDLGNTLRLFMEITASLKQANEENPDT